MILGFTIMRVNRNPDAGGWSAGEIVSVARARPVETVNPLCIANNLCLIYVTDVPGSVVSRIKARLQESDEDETDPENILHNRRRWRVRLGALPAQAQYILLNPPHAAVVGWGPFKNFLQHRRNNVVDAEQITDADL